MNFKAKITLLFLLIFTATSFSQITYFIKYKNYVSRSSINNKIQSKDFFKISKTKTVSALDFSAEYFADNLGKNDPNLSRIVKLTFANQDAANTFLENAKSDPSIQFVQPANVYKIDSIPNDSLVSKQWALQKIQAFKAWNITEGSDTVLIGIIDTGIDYHHPDLKNKIYINPGETGTDSLGRNKETNGIDDDHNGFIDDYMGWDFTDEKGFPFDSSGGDYLNWDNNPMDENGHGTYIAGIIAAETNNSIGIAGAAPKIKILNIRAFDPAGYGQEDDVAAAILYAVKMGCKVINMSFGDTQFSYVLRDVIEYAYNKGVVLVASSGNDGDELPHYPSGYSQVICVGNSTINDDVAPSSNYGSTLDLVAPGTDILTTAMGGGYASVSGTSASAPFVSAAAGLILSLGNFTNEEVKQILKSTADDIEQPGWDIKSGAGRLNLYRAVSVTAPSIIKFNYPQQDFSTNADTLNINATILSAYFNSYSLYEGTGLNPDTWITLVSNNQYQFNDKNIYTLNISDFKDSVYCLRLVVNLSSGRTMEERVNFNIIRNPPKTQLVFVGPAFYGEKSTILAAVYTNQPTIVRMYYKQEGTGNFNFVTLDGFNTNVQMVNAMHYGFIPKELITPNSNYEVYFEAQNLMGLKTILNNSGKNFIFSTNFPLQPAYQNEQPFTLPPGEIYENPVDITSRDSNEVILRKTSDPKVSSIYKLSGNNFIQIDSLQDKIVNDFGDFNGNGKKDLLASFVYNGFIMEQDSQSSTKFDTKFADTTTKFWPVLAKDIDNDGKTELMEIDSDTSFVIWKINSDLSLSDSVRLVNFTKPGPGGNVLTYPHAVITDMDGDGKNEIWMVDQDGDIFSYKILGNNKYQKDKDISSGFESSTAYLAAGHYTSSNKESMAVLLHSYTGSDIAPYYRLIIFNFIADSLNIVYDQTFVDPTTEFNSQFQKAENSLRFADLENSGTDDLILFIYPYSYIFKYNNGQNTIISYKENINSNSVFVGDINKDGVPDVAFPTNGGIKFYEFTLSNSPSTPTNLSGYSIDSTKILLTWDGSSSKYFIYRGTANNNIQLIDSTSGDTFNDSGINYGNNYYYGIKAVDYSKKVPESNLSQVIQVYSHSPAVPVKAVSQNQNTILVTFSNKINNTIDNLHSFEVQGTGFPNSISASSQFSYLLSYTNALSVGVNKLVIKDLYDFYGSPVKEDTLSFQVNSITEKNELFIASHEILSPFKIKITFNYDVDSASAFNKDNYIFTPYNNISAIQWSDIDKKVIYLKLDGTRPVGSVGREYTLHVVNLASSKQTGNILITNGAGSYLVLAKVADNLSDVYVYPSPARINGGAGKITFANIPVHVKITIFNINGKKINELEGNTVNGGIDYNLKDENGNSLESGIYIYRIVQLGYSNNEIAEKIGKFAVIK